MFKRRQPRTILQNIREVFWPSIGWGRAFVYTKHRILRLSDSNHKIAAGLAAGTSISFTPLVGTHFIQAGLIAYMMRANLLSSLVGTFAGNPWTFPFMWWASISFGSFLLSFFGLPAETTLPEHMNFSVLWQIMTHEPLRIFVPWLVGGYLIALLSWPLSYTVYYNLIRAAKIARRRAKLRRLHRAAKAVTGQKK